VRASGVAGLRWRPLAESDLTALTRLAARCLAADGGQPYAADPGFLSGCYLAGAAGSGRLAGAAAAACLADGELAGAVSVRRPPPDSSAAALGAAALTTGLVHPAWRRRGIGGRAFDWAVDWAGSQAGVPGPVCAETETLNDGAHALYLSRGLSQVFAEDVMRLDPSAPAPVSPRPAGLSLSPWGQADPARFYAVYTASFLDRPGFPGWSLAHWTAWLSDDEDFRADWTLLATVGGTDVGFVAGAAGGWIVQLGVVPSARGQGAGAYLVGEAVRRMRSAGETAITLNVNTNNPYAAALYRRTGFTLSGRRARYLS